MVIYYTCQGAKVLDDEAGSIIRDCRRYSIVQMCQLVSRLEPKVEPKLQLAASAHGCSASELS